MVEDNQNLPFLENKRIIIVMTKKQQFLLKHNQLSPPNLQATIHLLSRFKIEKALLFKNNNWSIDKLRRPFLSWLLSLTDEERENIEKKN